MKKHIAILLSLMLFLVACGQKAPTWQEQYDLGVRYLSEGNYEEAIIAFTAAIEIDPKRFEAYEKLANTYVALGDSESAVNILRQGVEAVGDDTLFRDYIDKLTAEAEQSNGLSSKPTPTPAPSGLRVEREDHSDGSYMLYYYDESGKLTQCESYYPGGTLWEILYYYYDTTWNLMRDEHYDLDGTMDFYGLYYYDTVGNKIRGECYNPDGTLEGISYYDAEWNITREEHYDAAGNLIGSNTYN